MEFDAMSPIWKQVVNSIKAELVSGKLQPGDKLPSGRELALKYSINPNTAARVYQELEAEGLCAPRRGLGTFVTADAHRVGLLRQKMARDALERCMHTLESLGVSRQEAAEMILQED